MKGLGIILLALGLIMLVYKGITYTTHKQVADLGPLEINKEEKHTFPISPIAGGVAVIAGIALIGLSGKRAH